MLLAMASFAIGDAIMKLVSGNMPLSQILVIRGCFAILILSVLVGYLGQMRPLSIIFSPAMVIRVAGELVATYFFLTALFNMPIANASAIMQALPLTVTMGAAVFFGEAIGWRRISAILVGLIGVLLIVQPGLDGFNIYSLYCIGAICGTTIRDLASRKLPAELPNLLAALIAVIGVFVGALILSIFQEWQPVTTKDVSYLAIASIFLTTGFFGIVAAMRIGEVAIVTPYRYSVLLFAIILGFLLFDEIPDTLTIIGSCVVVATGIYTFQRERRLAAQNAREANA